MSNKGKIIIASFGVVISIAVLSVSAVLAENAVISPALAVIVATVSVILTFVAILFASKVDYETSKYECKKCRHVFKPSFKAYIMGAHSLTTRRLKCPECGEKSWCKRKQLK